jgi:hypothetical protein
MTPLLSALHTTYADTQGGVRIGFFDTRWVPSAVGTAINQKSFLYTIQGLNAQSFY